MKILTKEQKIKDVPSSWYEQYKGWAYGNDKRIISDALFNAPELTEKIVNEIIGNDSWTKHVCDECGKDCDVLIQIGQEPDYESSTVQICSACLDKAYDLITTKGGDNEKV